MLGVIVLVALMLRLAVTPLRNFENLMDADHIHAWEPGNMARNLVAGRGFGSTLDSTQPSAMMTPVYPLIVAVLFEAFGVHTPASIFAVHALNCVLNALACIPIFLIARRSFGERVGRWAAWGWAIFPYGIYFSAAWAWSTHLLLLCLCWLLYLAQEMEQSSRLGLWAGFGLLAGFAGLTEPSALIVVPFLVALACWQLRRQGKSWFMPGAVASLALAAAISPWVIRNAMVFHRFIPMRDNMGLELWMGNNGYDLRWTSDDLHPLLVVRLALSHARDSDEGVRLLPRVRERAGAESQGAVCVMGPGACSGAGAPESRTGHGRESGVGERASEVGNQGLGYECA